MVICCVPGCNTDSWKSDGTVSFYDFPLNPGLKAKWIKQINTAIESKSMWFPRGRPVLCSKHFLNTDFKGDTDALKPRSIPSVFGHRYIGQDPESAEKRTLEETKLSPLIVKFKRPEVNVIENESKLHISDVCSQSDHALNSEADTESETNIFESKESKLHTLRNENDSTKDISSSTYSKNNLQSSYQDNTNRTKLFTNEISVVPEQKMYDTLKQNFPRSSNGISANNVSKKSLCKQPNLMPKMTSKRKETNDLIEIGPNTFLKINPDVIKVNKKQTPSGNTVLQFIMDQKLAKDYAGDLIPKLIQGTPSSSMQEKSRSETVDAKSLDLTSKETVLKTQQECVQHVIGHVIDNHVCEDSCVDLTLDEAELMDFAEDNEVCSNVSVDKSGHQNNTDKTATKCDMDGSLSNSAKSVLEKAPVLLTTNMPLSHCFIDRPKYILQLKQKNRQIANLKSKISALGKRIEELEDRCIVQERQLSYSFVKRLKTIQKNASKGDPCATYILEQIRSYAIINNSKMRWSDSSLTQCAIWCRKAPYAYEYFKKAGFFKLPCLGTVKRFIKKHPEIKFQKSVVHKSFPEAEGGDDGESSSDFDFDELDGQNGELSENENNESETCEKILSEIAGASISENSASKNIIEHKEKHEIQRATDSIANQSSVHCSEHTVKKNSDASDCTESSGIPITVDTSNLELQEIMLPSGEVVQCYSSNFVGGTESGQYFIIPNVNDQSNAVDHEYNVVQADSMPVILQNIENSQLHVQQDQLIFIANSSDQVECSETEVTSA